MFRGEKYGNGSISSKEMPTGCEQVHEAVDVRNGGNGGNELVTFSLIHPNDGKESIALTITGSSSSDDQERKSCVQRTICASIGVFMLMLIPVVQLWPESEQPPSSSTSPLQKLTTSGFDWTTSTSNSKPWFVTAEATTEPITSELTSYDWSSHLRCGPYFKQPGTQDQERQCSPLDKLCCCSLEGWCGDTEHHCYTSNYKVYCRDGPPVTTMTTTTLTTTYEYNGLKWRTDYRCGPSYPLEDGSESECNPDHHSCCCSIEGWCGDSEVYCNSSLHKNYCRPSNPSTMTTDNPDMTSSEDPIPTVNESKWRLDFKCGPSFLLHDGSETECKPDHPLCCCSTEGWCGDSEQHCNISLHKSYCRPLSSSAITDVEKTTTDFGYNGTKWREDTRCGPMFPLEDGSEAQCNPHEDCCCSKLGWCGSSDAHCIEEVANSYCQQQEDKSQGH